MNKELLKREISGLNQEAKELWIMFCLKAQIQFSFSNEEREIAKKHNTPDYSLDKHYNSFFTRTSHIIETVLPTRIDEFKWCYIRPNDTFSKYDISTYIRRLKAVNLSREYEMEALTLFERQMAVLQSAEDVLDTVLFNLEHDIRHNIYTDELDVAKHLLKKGYIRAAGSVAGVVLEMHLKNLCIKNTITIQKDDGLSSYNAKLKKIIGDILWGRIDAVSRIRNTCDHAKDAEPTKSDVELLISETENIISEGL